MSIVLTIFWVKIFKINKCLHNFFYLVYTYYNQHMYVENKCKSLLALTLNPKPKNQHLLWYICMYNS